MEAARHHADAGSEAAPVPARFVDPAVRTNESIPNTNSHVKCLRLPAHVAARLNAAASLHAQLPCLHSADSPDTHGSGITAAADATVSLNLRKNALTSLRPPAVSLHDGVSTLPLVPSPLPLCTPLHVFQHLLALDLNDNQLRDLEGIDVLPHLLSLRVARNKLVSISALWRAPCAAHLDVLDVTGNQLETLLSDGDVASVRAAEREPQLRVLYASDNRLSNVDTVLGVFTNVEDVRLRRNALTDVSPAFLPSSEARSQTPCSVLRYLDVAENPLNAETCRVLKTERPDALQVVISSPAPTPVATAKASSPSRASAASASPDRAHAVESAAALSSATRHSVKKEPPARLLTAGPSPMTVADARDGASPSCAVRAQPAAEFTPAKLSFTSSAPSSRVSSPSPPPACQCQETPHEETAVQAAPIASASAATPPRRSTALRSGVRTSAPIAGEYGDGKEVQVQTLPDSDPRLSSEPGSARLLKPTDVACGDDDARRAASIPRSSSTLAGSPATPSLLPEVMSEAADTTRDLRWLTQLSASAVDDPQTGVQKVAENTYVVDVDAAFAAFEKAVMREMLQGAAGAPFSNRPATTTTSRAGAGNGDVLHDPVTTAAMLSRLPGLALVFQTETFITAPTLVLDNITPLCTRATVMQQLFVTHLLRSLKMKEEAARTRLLRSRTTAAVGSPTSASDGRSGRFSRQISQQLPQPPSQLSQRELVGGSSGVEVTSPVEGMPVVVEFHNASGDAPALHVCHILSCPSSPSDSSLSGGEAGRTLDRQSRDGSCTARDPLPYMRWRREWEEAVARRKLTVDAHYLLNGAPSCKTSSRHENSSSQLTDAAAIPAAVVTAFHGCGAWLSGCWDVPLTWSLLYAQVVLDRGDGLAIARRKGRGRAKGRRLGADARGRMASAFHRVTAPRNGDENEEDDDDSEDDAADDEEETAVRTARRAQPVSLPALQRPLLEAARPLTAMHVAAPHWSCDVVENYAAVCGAAVNPPATNRSASVPGFARSASSQSTSWSRGVVSGSVAFNLPANAASKGGVNSSTRAGPARISLAQHDYVRHALKLHCALRTHARHARSEIDTHAAQQVIACPLDALDSDGIARNREARNNLWRCFRQAQSSTSTANDEGDAVPQEEETHDVSAVASGTSIEGLTASVDHDAFIIPTARTRDLLAAPPQSEERMVHSIDA